MSDVCMYQEGGGRYAITDLVTASHEGSTGNIEETQIFRNLLPSFEFSWFNISVDFHMSFRRSHVLTKRNNVDVRLPQFYECKLEV